MPSNSLDSRHFPGKHLFAGQDIPWQLEHWAKWRGDHRFLIWEPKSGADRSWTYAEFWTEVRQIASGMHARGIVKGDRVLIHSDNCPEMVIAWYACATLGAIAVTTNTACVGNELAQAARHAGIRAAITQPRYAALVAAHAGALDWLAVMDENSVDDPSGASDPPWTGDPFDTLRGNPDDLPVRPREALLPAGILYTSGTTSQPKAVVHTHANILWAGRIGPHLLHFGPEDVHFALMPFFHVNAQSWVIAVALGVGASVVLLPQPTISRFWEIVVKHGITHMSVMPLILRTYENVPVPDGHRLKMLQGGVPHTVFSRRTGAMTIGAYGMSETVVHTIHTDPVHHWPEGSIGRATPGYEVRLVSQQTGADCGPEEDGELWVRGIRGVQLFLEYYDNPQANEKAFTADGWFKTGDVMRMDNEGVLFYRDRDKDRIKVGGENISASEVESIVMQVSGVAQAAVVARRDPRLDEVAVVFIVRSECSPNEESLCAEILAHCERNLSRFKRPRAVHFIDALPLGLLNKVSKVKLREMAEQLHSTPDHAE
jgi:crotonobetaine/carnitine-CoA ligase